MLTTTEMIGLGGVAYVIVGIVSSVYFDRRADRADYPQPGEYELVRFMAGALWFLWPLRWYREWRRSRRSEPERPPE